MSEETKKAPAIRFQGFTDDWEQRKLGDLSEITDTKHATAPVVDFETPYKMIRTSAVRDGRLFPDRMDYVTYDTYEQWSERIHLKPNDVVISREAPMGEAAVIPTDNNKYFLGQRMVGIRVCDDLDPFFLLATFLAPKFRKEIQIRNAESTTVANFGIPSIKGCEVDIPKKEEQTKIGSFFRQLDNTIALHQRKLTLFNQLKETYLKQMFPQNEENMPVLRFADFSEPWEQRKWSETVDISTEMVNPKTGEYDSLPHIGPGNIESFTGRILDNVKSVKEDNLISGKFHFYPGDVIYGKINPQLGKYAMVDFEGLASADSYVLNTKNGVSQTFLFTILQGTSFYKYSVSVSMRTGMPKINRDELNQYSYSAPSVVEQEKIGHFFQQLDDTSALHQEKIAHLKVLKTTLLNKMFI